MLSSLLGCGHQTGLALTEVSWLRMERGPPFPEHLPLGWELYRGWKLAAAGETEASPF